MLALLAACSGTGDLPGPGAPPVRRPRDPSRTRADAHRLGRARPRCARGSASPRLAMPAAYTPSAPTGAGTDDYRCFLLDPRLASDAFVTGIDVLPGNPDVVHHVILFRVPPELGGRGRRRKDAAEPGQGWTCFGGTGLDDRRRSLDNAPWLGAWAPGGGERVTRPTSASRWRPARGSSCRCTTTCSRAAARPSPPRGCGWRRATADLEAAARRCCCPPRSSCPAAPRTTVGRCATAAPRCPTCRRRFGDQAGQTANALHLLCGYEPAGPVQQLRPRIVQSAGDAAGRGRAHAPARPVDPDHRRPRHRPRADRCSTSRCGTSTTRARTRSTRCT